MLACHSCIKVHLSTLSDFKVLLNRGIALLGRRLKKTPKEIVWTLKYFIITLSISPFTQYYRMIVRGLLSFLFSKHNLHTYCRRNIKHRHKLVIIDRGKELLRWRSQVHLGCVIGRLGALRPKGWSYFLTLLLYETQENNEPRWKDRRTR